MRLKNTNPMPLVLLLVAVFALTGCTTGQTDRDLSFISAADAEQLVHGEKQLLGLGGTKIGTWVDSRSETDFLAGHIPGAVNLPYERVTADHRKLKDYKILIVYGEDYNDVRANGMSKRLLALGYDDVRTLTGGMRAWKAAGNAPEIGAGEPINDAAKRRGANGR